MLSPKIDYADMEERSPQTVSGLPLMIIVGGDALALKACQELTAHEGQDVTVVWQRGDDQFAKKVRDLGANFVGARPGDVDALREAGVMQATSLMALSDDDHLNLLVALRARDLNPNIRLVLRQFNRTLGRKLEQNLPNCSVISLSAHSAATYAGTAVDRHCFYGLQFPDIDGPIVGFSLRHSAVAGLDGMTAGEAAEHLGQRIVAIDGDTNYDRGARLSGASEVVTFGVVRPSPAVKSAPATVERGTSLLSLSLGAVHRQWVHLGAVVQRLLLGAVLFFALAATFFSFKLHIDPLKAAYYVSSTMTTVGYGDITPKLDDKTELVGAMLLMFVGVTLTGIFTAILTSRLTQAQWVAVQGLRRIKRRGHIIVCGSGNVGSRVIEDLINLGVHVVVVEAEPKPSIVERSRDRHFDLLTGDATQDSTLELCNLAHAEALIALTNSDTMNLEIALGARARNPEMTIVVRVQEAAFEASVRRHFGITRTYSTAALAAPVLAGLSRFPGARGRIEIGAHEYSIGEFLQGDAVAPPPIPNLNSTPLCVWRDGGIVLLDDSADIRPHDRMLLLFPSWQLLKHPTE